MQEKVQITELQEKGRSPLPYSTLASEGMEWARLASNQRPADYESAALTRLSYGPPDSALETSAPAELPPKQGAGPRLSISAGSLALGSGGRGSRR
jgi:hypothetical protein